MRREYRTIFFNKSVCLILLFIFLLSFQKLGAEEKIVYRGFTSKVVTSYTDIENEIKYNTYSRLVSFKSYNSITPDLAYKWTINKKGTVYDFYLRKNIVLHNGDILTVQDIKISLERSLLRDNLYFLDKNIVVGLKDFLDGKEKHIKGIECLDKNILRIRLNKPYVFFLRALATPLFAIYKKVNGKPISTGPYIIKKRFKKGRFLVKAILEKNKKYYLPLKSPDKIVIIDVENNKLIPDIFSVNSLETEEYLKEFKQYKKYKAPDIFLHSILFNFKSFWGSNKYFRNFIGYGFNFKKSIKEIYKYYDPIYNIIPSSLPNYNKVPKFPSYNYKKAVEYLRKIKGRGKEVKLLTFNILKRDLFARELKKFLEVHKFKVKEKIFDVYKGGDVKKAFLSSDLIIAGFKNNEDIFNPAFFLFKSLNARGNDNLFNYKNIYIEDLTKKLITDEIKDRERVMKFIINLVNEDMPIIPYTSSYIIYFVNKKVKLTTPPLLPHIDYRSVRLNEK